MSAGVITSTVGLVSRISLHITSADAVSDAFDLWTRPAPVYAPRAELTTAAPL